MKLLTGLRGYTVIWAGQLVGVLGSSITRFAIPLWVWQETHSATAMAYMGLFAMLPLLLFSPLAGALVDRWSHHLKRVMMISDVTNFLCGLLLLLLLGTGNLALGWIYALMALQALAEERGDGLPLDARMVRIMSKRAKAVLAAAKDQPADAQGCQPVSLAPLHDAGYVAIPLIEAGRVAVWSAQSNALAATLRIRQDSCGLDAPAGGFSATIDGEATAFFAMITCVT